MQLVTVVKCSGTGDLINDDNLLSYAINPARDLGPRLMLLCFGWGSSAFTASPGWWWIPVLCCHLGAIIGAGIYLVLIELEWSKSGTENTCEDIEEKETI